jgi:glycosyltransferase involved in cell wall biosynthesis
MQKCLIKNIGRHTIQGIIDAKGIKSNLDPNTTLEVYQSRAVHLVNSYPQTIQIVKNTLSNIQAIQPVFIQEEIKGDWKLKYIPKVAHLYWSGDILPWLRMISIESFCKLNPEWQVNIYLPENKYQGSVTWKTHELKYEIKGQDYFNQLKNNCSNIKINKIDMASIGIKNDIPEVFKADFLRFYLLSTVGGLWLDTDIIFFKSMNEFYKNNQEYSNKKTWACFNDNYHSMGFLMSSKDNLFFKKMFEQSKVKFNINNYQGVFIDVMPMNAGILSQYEHENIELDTVYPINSFELDLIYNADNSFMLTKNTIGLHWYGGCEYAGKAINLLNEQSFFKTAIINNTLCKCINKYFKEATPNRFKIITTNKNADKYIGKCIDSVLSQTYKEWEMIIIDDCSSDNSVNIIKSKLNDKIKLIANSKTKNKLQNVVDGIKNICKNDNDIIVILDGDDWLADNNVLEYLNNIYKNKDIWLTYGQFEPVSKKYSKYCRPIDTLTYRLKDTFLTSHLKTFKKIIWNKLDEKDLKDDNNNYLYTDDVAFMTPMVEIAGNKHIKFIEKVLYIYNDLNVNCAMYSEGERLEAQRKEIMARPSKPQIDKPKISILITTFKRNHLLKWNLLSLSKQNIDKYDYEILILDEGREDKAIHDLIDMYKNLNIIYINTGKTKQNQNEWRVPGYAFNIGAKKCKGDYILLMCAEIFSINETIDLIMQPVIDKDKIISTPQLAKDDIDSSFLNMLEKQDYKDVFNMNNLIPLNVLLPFFMAMNKRDYFSIGGYDERMNGVAREDDDFVERLVRKECKYVKSSASIVHLYHERLYDKKIDPAIMQRVAFNDKIYKENKNVIKVNLYKEWGKF